MRTILESWQYYAALALLAVMAIAIPVIQRRDRGEIVRAAAMSLFLLGTVLTLWIGVATHHVAAVLPLAALLLIGAYTRFGRHIATKAMKEEQRRNSALRQNRP